MRIEFSCVYHSDMQKQQVKKILIYHQKPVFHSGSVTYWVCNLGYVTVSLLEWWCLTPQLKNGTNPLDCLENQMQFYKNINIELEMWCAHKNNSDDMHRIGKQQGFVA